MMSENSVYKKLTVMMKSGKMTYVLITIGFISALVIVFTPEQHINVEKNYEEINMDSQTYEAELTKEISSMVSAITSEASPHVMITLHTNGETVYATEDKVSERSSQEYSETVLNKTQMDGDSEKTYIIVKAADGSQKPLIITQTKPEIQGIVIVSDYGSNAAVREKITQAVKTALNLSSTQVCVVGRTEYT